MKMKVLLAGAECVPFAKTGGLADVVGTLSRELVRIGIDARVIMPLHRQIKDKYFDKMQHICSFSVQLGWRNQYVGIHSLVHEGVTFYFVDNEYYFGWQIYKGGEAEGEQYAFFCRAVMEAMPLIEFIPDILHANDWHTAMLPFLIKTQYASLPQGTIKTLVTIHNLKFQGRFAPEFIKDVMSVPDEFFTADKLEIHGAGSFLKAGLVYADKLGTVSHTYSREIMTPEYGEGLEGVLKSREADLSGILNGIDTEEFDPAKDKAIAAAYSVKNMAGKAKCRKALAQEMGFDIDDDTPIIGMVSRLTEQKGVDLIRMVIDRLMSEKVVLAVLGSGDMDYQSFFSYAAGKYKGRIGYCSAYNDGLAHRIYAGSDLFLMPSRFEPCGISQMIALRYGSLPIVRETGGLKDTVAPYNKYTGEGTGFTFTNYNADDMLHVIKEAIAVFRDKKAYSGLVKNAMLCENSFEKSAREYEALFKSMLA